MKVTYKRYILFILAIIALLPLISCQPTPDEDVIVNKHDFEDHLLDNETPPTEIEKYTKLLPETVEQELEKDNVKVSIDADVICNIKENSIPIYKFEKAVLTQDAVDRWVEYFAGSNKLYSWPNVYTKDEYAQEIINAKKGTLIDGEYVFTEEDKERVQELERLYAEAPEGGIKQYITTKLTYKDINPMSVQYGKIYLNAAVEAEGDDFIIYAKSPLLEDEESEGYSRFVMSVGMNLISESTVKSQNENELISGSVVAEGEEKLQKSTITVKQAQPIADNVISELGIEGFELAKSEKASLGSFNNQYGIESNSPETYGLKLVYMRKVGGASIDPDIDDVINPITRHDSEGNLLTAPSIDVEKIIIYITNEGEIGHFEYCGMLEASSMITEAVTLMDFDEMVEQAMNQMYYENAYSEIEGLTKEINIDSISLVMTYVSKKNDLSSVLLIPAWKFNGIIAYSSDSASSEEPITVTVNAIDGSRA